MSRRIRLDPAAAAELDDAADWYQQQRTGLGREFVVAARAAMRGAARRPRLGSPLDDSDPTLELRRVFVVRFPYQVIYFTTDDDLYVVAVAHERRLPGYWRDRLP